MFAHRVDAPPVVWMEKTGIEAVGLGNKALSSVACGDGVEVFDDFDRLVDEFGRIGLDVAHGQVVGVGVVIVGVDSEPGRLEGVPDPGCARKEVDDRSARRCGSMAQRDDLIDEETL